MYRLNITRLRAIAKQHGDKTAWAIAKTTGINVSSAYRIHSGETQPDLISALRIAVAYDLDIRELMDRVENEDTDDGDTDDEPAGVAA